jgi:hypothetical protein
MRSGAALAWIALAAALALAACSGAPAGTSSGHPSTGAGTPSRADGPAGLITPDGGAAYTFTGWGTSLAWWAERSPSWPDRQQILSDLFTAPRPGAPAATPGLGLTVLRYNLGASLAGGVQAPACPLTMRPGATVPSLEPRPGQVAAANDPAQEQVLTDAAALIRNGGETPVVEAFANSPPWWLLSGRADPGRCTSGGVNGAADLPPGASADMAYARYLATVTRLLTRQTGVRVDTIEPFNEPVSVSWVRGNTQEGSFIAPAQQARIVTDLCRIRHPGVGISAPDTNSPAQALAELTAGPMSAPAVKSCLAQVNTHAYDGGQPWPVASPVWARLRQAAGTRISMSEFGVGDPAGVPPITPALSLSLEIAGTLNNLRPADWVYWQAVEHSGGWGLIDSPGQPVTAPAFTLRYWALDQYSRFIRPGSRILPASGANVVCARTPSGRYVVVLTNEQPESAPFAVDLSGAGLGSAAVRGYQTRSRGMAAVRHAPAVSGGRLQVVEPAESITTYVLTPRS